MSCDGHDSGSSGGLSEHVLHELVAMHREFLGFVDRRVGDRALAEDLVQDAFVKSLERGGELRDDESARAWFYRVLRNAIVDRQRRTSSASGRLAKLADELQRAEEDRTDAADREICQCVARLIDTLPADQATALRRIELDGIPVKQFAAESSIGESNAGVRVFRARKALRERVTRSCGTCAEHGCFDCSCGSPKPQA
ncbi:MAG: sigma-70 family RNA polymerase sigma factor [Planctomycetes bacterium]|nr:sigma-70 family RNA polymerase sigma factor [Planctomycetota bacterium]